MTDFWNQIFKGFETIMLAEFAEEYIVCDAASLLMHFEKKISKICFHLAWIFEEGESS